MVTTMKGWVAGLALVMVTSGCDPRGLAALQGVARGLADNPENQKYAAVVAALGSDAQAETKALEQLIDLNVYVSRPQTLDKDRDGQTLLDILNAMAISPRAPGLTNQDVLKATIRLLKAPEVATQGSNRGTCGAATVQYVMASRFPEDFASFVERLTSLQMEARTRNGRRIALAQNSLPDDGTGRSSVERIFQSALMNEMNLVFDYNNTSDDGGFWATIWGNSGQYPSGVADALTTMSGKTYTTKSTVITGEADAINQTIIPHVKAGEYVPISVNWSKTSSNPFDGHFVTVVKVIEGGSEPVLQIYNPWGTKDSLTGGPSERLLVSASDAQGNAVVIPGMCTFTRSQLAKRLTSAIYQQ